MKDADKLLDEVTKSFSQEFDYRLESGNMRICSNNMKIFKNVYIPAPIDKQHPSCPPDSGRDGLCTKKVLCMEQVDGVPIKKKMKAVFEDIAEQ